MQNTDADEIPDYDNLSDDDDDEIQYSDRFGMHYAFLQFKKIWYTDDLLQTLLISLFEHPVITVQCECT